MRQGAQRKVIVTALLSWAALFPRDRGGWVASTVACACPPSVRRLCTHDERRSLDANVAELLACVGLSHADVARIREEYPLRELLDLCLDEALELLPVTEKEALSIVRCGTCEGEAATDAVGGAESCPADAEPAREGAGGGDGGGGGFGRQRKSLPRAWSGAAPGAGGACSGDGSGHVRREMSLLPEHGSAFR